MFQVLFGAMKIAQYFPPEVPHPQAVHYDIFLHSAFLITIVKEWIKSIFSP